MSKRPGAPPRRVYRFKSRHRRGKLVVVETPREVYFNVTLSRYGAFGDEAQVGEWLGRIAAPYDGDGRALVLRHPLSGEVARIYDPGFALITLEPLH